ALCLLPTLFYLSLAQPHVSFSCFFFNDPAPTEIYTLSLHDALPILVHPGGREPLAPDAEAPRRDVAQHDRSCRARLLLRDVTSKIGKHTSELQSRENLVCRLLLEKKKKKKTKDDNIA